MDNLTELSKISVFAVADALGMSVELDETKRMLHGDNYRDLDVNGLLISFHQRIVSSVVAREGVALLLRVKGNLCFFVLCTPPEIEIHLINLAKLSGGVIEGWLERHQRESIHDYLPLLQGATVQGFRRSTAARKWSPVHKDR